MTWRLCNWFLVAQVLTCGVVFREALFGRALLAPLDIAPALFTKYRYADPSSNGAPGNHRIIDQLIYDLPLQWTIYQAYRRGETPWWDPYTCGGRPLLADAHLSGADPVRRLCYQLLPFEQAYNWTRVTHFVLCGLGMLLLLRRLGVQEIRALLLAIAYEFGGGFEVFFGHPWIQASFVYYPFLWLAWEKAFEGNVRSAVLASMLFAAIFYAGNLQSHTYLVVFALCLGVGLAGRNWRSWRKMVFLLAGTLVLGALLAAPLLMAELELFSRAVRDVGTPFNPLGCLAGLGSVAACFPWGLGTCQTLDLSKLLDRGFHLGFSPFIGCAAFFLAVVGAFSTPSSPVRVAARRAALCLCGSYLLIISTPLNQYLYMRCAPLAMIGLTVLAAFGLEYLIETGDAWRRMGRTVLGLALGLAIITNAFAAFIYPRLVPDLRQYVTRKAARNPAFDEAPTLRESQIKSLPAEVSFLNPEAVLGFASLVALGTFLMVPSVRRNSWAWAGLLLLNVLPELVHSRRALPHHPMALWYQLQAGGPEHQRLAAQLRDTPLRVLEIAPGINERLYPGALSAVYRVRTVLGYAALRPRGPSTLTAAELERWRPQVADRIYESTARGQATGDLRTNATPGLARFQWMTPLRRPFTITEPNLHTIHVSFDPGPGGTLLWSDSFYPGWIARLDSSNVPVKLIIPCFNAIEIPASANTLVLQYEPRFLRLGKTLAWLATALLVLLVWVGRARNGFCSSQAQPPTAVRRHFDSDDRLG